MKKFLSQTVILVMIFFMSSLAASEEESMKGLEAADTEKESTAQIYVIDASHSTLGFAVKR